MAGSVRSAPTQRDVAAVAGVSRATVSAVINGQAASHRIPAGTEKRVREAVQSLGYVANPAARALRQKRNRLLGVHSFDSVFPISSRDFYHEFLIGVEQQAVAEGHDLVLFTSTEDPDGQRQLYRDGTNRLNVADGSVLLGVTHQTRDLARLANEGYPFVHIGRRDVPGAEFAWVGADYEQGTRQVVTRLAELGHRRIGYLGSTARYESQIDRENGYLAACAAEGIPPMPVYMRSEDLNLDWFLATVNGGVSAFVVVPGRHAEILADLAEQSGLRIPQEVSIAVLTDAQGGPAPEIPWCAMQIPRQEIGRQAVQLLARLLENPASVTERQVLLPCVQPEETTMAERPE